MAKGKQIDHASKFTQTLEASAQLPGVRIDRSAYLRSSLKRYCTDEQIECAVATTPAAANVPADVISAIANTAIKYETSKATALSVAAGLPGGWAIAGTVPADLAQYFGHVLRIAQKLAYIYSWPDLFGEDGDGIDDATEGILTLFVGVMFGVVAAQGGVAKIAALMSGQVVKKLPQKALTKGVLYPVVKKVAAYLGVRMTKQIYAGIAAKAVPVAGAVFSGGLTYATFRPMAYRLDKHLASLALTKPGHQVPTPTPRTTSETEQGPTGRTPNDTEMASASRSQTQTAE
ncbi:hypothetical protein [Rhodococcus globerulus]|uniref:hypothetical protein n=1 Tax=Rhodococcus globerulus TaxID=33008 RepID=UPI001C55C02B|nr:hypothetical protein [Rhodococcus globerulus]QXW00757.1 hypothetical protein KYT97_20485 [Rhodococcus globerulus]